MTLCRASLNPELSDGNVDEMLIQHLLTERLMRNLFQNPEFTKRNVIAAQVEGVIEALASSSFSTAEFLKRLDPYLSLIHIFTTLEIDEINSTTGQQNKDINSVVIKKLPELDLSSRDHQVGDLPLWYSFDSSAGLLSRSEPDFYCPNLEPCLLYTSRCV